jgi:3-hydroxyacyl-[acyl-carrier-protein] dehydratase
MELNLEDIKKILPHREPFLFIDKVVELEKGKKVVAIKNITGKEDYFKGHFPGKPIMPGVLIAEAMAQAAVVLADSVFPKEKNKRYIYYLGRANIRFLKPVIPQASIRVTAIPLKLISELGIVKTEAYVNEDVVARGEISFGRRAH